MKTWLHLQLKDETHLYKKDQTLLQLIGLDTFTLQRQDILQLKRQDIFVSATHHANHLWCKVDSWPNFWINGQKNEPHCNTTPNGHMRQLYHKLVC